MAELSKTESGLVTYFLDQLYVVKSKIQQLEKGVKEMKLALSSCERRIKVVENRKYMFFVFQNVIGKSNKIIFMI